MRKQIMRLSRRKISVRQKLTSNRKEVSVNRTRVRAGEKYEIWSKWKHFEGYTGPALCVISRTQSNSIWSDKPQANQGLSSYIIHPLLCFIAMLGIEPRATHMPGMHFSTELYLQDSACLWIRWPCHCVGNRVQGGKAESSGSDTAPKKGSSR